MAKISSHSAMQIVQEISKLIQQQVNIIDHRGYIIASTDRNCVGEVYKGTKKGIDLPILVEGEIIGSIGLTGEPSEIQVYGQIIQKMTEILVSRDARNEEEIREQKIRNRYIGAWLFDSTEESREDFIKRGQLLGIDITVPRRVMVGMIPTEGIEGDTSECQRLLDQVERTLKQRIKEDHPQNIFFKSQSKFIALVVHRSNEQMKEMALKDQKLLKEKYNIDFAIGIDRCTQHYTVMNKVYNDAYKALLASLVSVDYTPECYEDITLQIFMSDVENDLKEEFVERIFNQMSVEDIKKCIRILEVFFNADGSIGQASSELLMHKNTLQYKLNKIHEKTGYDPRKIKDVPLFYMAMLFYKELYYEKEKYI